MSYRLTQLHLVLDIYISLDREQVANNTAVHTG